MLAKRIGVLIRLLGSNFEGEAIGAATGLRRLLSAEGLSFGDVALLIENCDGRLEALRFSENDAKAIYERGIEIGKTQANGCSLSDQYFDLNGNPRWVELVTFCQTSSAKMTLKPNEREFLDELPAKLRWRMTRPMGGFLLSIFWKLGGSFK
jgi:hypothetical protein